MSIPKKTLFDFQSSFKNKKDGKRHANNNNESLNALERLKNITPAVNVLRFTKDGT